MGLRKLPKKGSRREVQLKIEYPTADKKQLRKWAKEFGFSSVTNFMSAVRDNLKLKRIRQAEVIDTDSEVVVNLPAITLNEYKGPRTGKGDEEVAVLLASDGHAGKITKSYDEDVYNMRMDELFNSLMTIITLHRHMYPIKKLVVLNLGDNIQGENPFQGSKIGTASMGARDQTVKIAFPAWVKLIGSLKQEFEEIEFHGFGGNHGHERLAPETSREDFRLYDLLQAYFTGLGNTKISIEIYEEFADIVRINGFKFFCFHGDGIPCQQGVPFFALDKKLKSWYMQCGGFSYACGGHFHKRHTDEVSSKFEYFMNASMVSDDSWALKKLGISSSPSQWVLGVHPRHGVTYRYPLIVDYKFLPEKLGSEK